MKLIDREIQVCIIGWILVWRSIHIFIQLQCLKLSSFCSTGLQAFKALQQHFDLYLHIVLVNLSRQVKCDVNGWKKCRWLKFWLIGVCCKSVLQNVFQGEFKKLLAKRQAHEIQSTPSEGLLTYCTSSKDNIIIILSYGTPTSTLQFS